MKRLPGMERAKKGTGREEVSLNVMPNNENLK